MGQKEDPGATGGLVTPPLLQLSRAQLLPLDRALGMEWLQTDGVGGYATSTVVMCPTRRYHGLLVTAPPGHAARHNFLSRFEEALHRPEREFPLSTGRYPGTWNPTGYAGLESFALTPHPAWTYRVGRTAVTREILLVHGCPIVLCRYGLDSLHEDIVLKLRPLLPFRAVDDLTSENLHLNPRIERRGDGILLRPYEPLPPLGIRVVGADAAFEADPTWYRNVEYQRDIARGYPGHEDQFNPGWFNVPLRPGQDVIVASSLEDIVDDPLALWAKERARLAQLVAPEPPGLEGRLQYAAIAFPYRRATGRPGVQAGYPWCDESARDTLVSLPGLTLAQGDVEACGAVLQGLLRHLRAGLLPSRFGPTPDTNEYRAADPSLWLSWAVRRYQVAGGDPALVQDRLRPVLREIAECYLDGTELEIQADADALLRAGRPDLAVTWMDACVEGRPVTPRDGHAVELNALWYHLLAHLEALAAEADDGADLRRWRGLRRRAKSAFSAKFWLAREARLADRWAEGAPVDRIRPNMVIAAALEWSPLTRGQRTDVVRCARAELLTPFGLRTLSPQDPAYQGHYDGGPEARDRAAHQGTAWPWLLGFFAEAWLRAYGFRGKRVAFLRSLLEGLAPHLEEGGLLQVSELFDGDPPHDPGGALARAWGVAEPLRALRILEDGRF